MGKIFLSCERGIVGNAQSTSYSTFNFGEYFNEHKTAFGNLYVWNEEILGGSQNITIQVQEASHIVIIPITGALTINSSNDNTCTVHVEEVQVLTLPANSSIGLANPYASEVVHFLQIRIKAEEPVLLQSFRRFDFNLQERENELLSIIDKEKGAVANNLPFSLSIALFEGRKEAIYTVRDKKSGLFAFVIAGAFEVEGRLLHEKDGLALWNTEKIELEALSNNALVLVMELPSEGNYPISV